MIGDKLKKAIRKQIDCILEAFTHNNRCVVIVLDAVNIEVFREVAYKYSIDKVELV